MDFMQQRTVILSNSLILPTYPKPDEKTSSPLFSFTDFLSLLRTKFFKDCPVTSIKNETGGDVKVYRTRDCALSDR